MTVSLGGRARLLLAPLVTALVLTAPNGVAAQESEARDVVRIAGADRYATAAAASEALFADGAETVVVASGESSVDAMAAGPVARALVAPILLTRRDGLPSATLTELVRLQAQRAIVVGGDTVVGEGVLEQLRERVQTVERVADADRYGTAVALSSTFFESGRQRVYLAAGEGFADAVVAAAAAAHDGVPVLLTPRDGLPDAVGAEITRLDPDDVYVVGGASSVGDQVREQLLDRLRDRDHDGDGTPDQDRDRDRDRIHLLAGADRQHTAAVVAANAFPSPTGRAFLANGWSFADATVASAFGDPILLVERDRMTDQTREQLDRLCTTMCVSLGGTVRVSDELLAELAAG